MKTLLGSAVIAAICSGLVSYGISRYQGNLQYITGERKEWRKKIRKIATRLHKADYKETLEILTDLKVRINAFGNTVGNKGVSSSFKDDAYIWKLINEIEEKEPCPKVLKLQQELLIQYLSLLLKSDWERSKKEVMGDIYKLLSRICYISSACVVVLPYFFLKTVQQEVDYISAVVILLLVTVFGATHFVFTDMIYSKCMERLNKTGKNVNVCYIIVIVVMVLLLCICAGIIDIVLGVIGSQSVNRAIMVVAYIIYGIGLIMQGTINLEAINETHRYNRAIDALKKKYEEEF